MVERVAKALLTEHLSGRNGEKPPQKYIDRSFGVMMPLARVAIAAMRDPTEEMMFCGVADLYKTDDPEEEVEKVWQAMIDAALPPPPQEQEGSE